MKPTNIILIILIILGLSLLFSAGNLFGQTNQAKQPLIDTLDSDSQTNIVVIRNGGWPLPPCPSKYTNLISNTNLFSSAEQKLLLEIPLKYQNVTTNAGPLGSVLTALNKDINGHWVASFQYTNSDARDEVTFGAWKSAKFLNKSGDGYGVNMDYMVGKSAESIVLFCQLKHGMTDGLLADYYDNGHCLSWMRFSNGMAVGKWLEWNSDGGLRLEVEFKTPYDFQKHYHPPNIE